MRRRSRHLIHGEQCTLTSCLVKIKAECQKKMAASNWKQPHNQSPDLVLSTGGIECFQAFCLSQHVREKYVMALVTAYFASENSLTVCGLHTELFEGDLNEEPNLPGGNLKKPPDALSPNSHGLPHEQTCNTENNLCILWREISCHNFLKNHKFIRTAGAHLQSNWRTQLPGWRANLHIYISVCEGINSTLGRQARSCWRQPRSQYLCNARGIH